MNRQEYIDAVKVKIEEISPFDEPEHFIGEDDDSANTVKPIKEYIIRSLDEAAHNCLLSLPLSLLHADVEKLTSLLTPDEKYAEGDIEDGKVRTYIDEKGVGRLNVWQNIRLVRYHHSALQRDITAFITTEDPLYLIQQNKFTRPGQCKPVGVWSAAERQMEIYSFPKELYDTMDDSASLYAINLNKHVDNQSTKPYITITNSEDRYYPFDKPTDEYNGTTFGRKVLNVWYRGWRTEDGQEVYTLGNTMPEVGATIYQYNGSSMSSIAFASYITITDSDTKYYPMTGESGIEYDGHTYGRSVDDTWYRGWKTEGGVAVYTEGDDLPFAGDDVYQYSNGAMALINSPAYITISKNGTTTKYFAFTGSAGQEYDGTTYGKRVQGNWYRGWRSYDGEDVYTYGDSTPSAGAKGYLYNGVVMLNLFSVTSYSASTTKKIVESEPAVTYYVRESVEGVTDPSYVKSPIEYFIILECAAMVLDILGRHDAAANFRNEIQLKVLSILK